MTSRFRPPRDVPDIGASPAEQARFKAWIRTAFVEIAEDLSVALSVGSPGVIEQERVDLPADASRRVSPSPAGAVVVLPCPSPVNAGAISRLFIENPSGRVIVAATPGVGADGKVFQPTINGQVRATFTLPGVVTFHSNGANDWKAQAESPGETAATAASAAEYVLGSASSALARARVLSDSETTVVDRSTPGQISIIVGDPASGYLSRGWYTTPGTSTIWSTEEDLPPGNTIELVAWSGGGAGGNGRVQTAAGVSLGGSAAGGGGCRHAKRFPRAFIIAELPISLTVGAGVSPPARATTAAGSLTQTSTPGTFSGWTGASGVLVSAYGGGAGQALNLASGGGGGGFLGTGAQSATTGANNGGQPGAAQSGTGVSGGGGFGGDEGNAVGDNGFAACGGGGGGGGSGRPTSGGAPGASGGNADLGAGGGGGGGPMTGSGTVAGSQAGGPGGASGHRSDGVLFGSGPAGGTTGNPGNPGTDGTDLTLTDINYERSGNGGGGGASSAVVGTTGGRGGHGAAPGGGGGAGGDGRGADGTAWGGAGGNGARGQGAYTSYA